MGKFAELKLSDVAHAREGVLELAQFTVEPTLASAVIAQVWLQQGVGIHLGAAFLASDSTEQFVFDRDNFCGLRYCRFHVHPPGQADWVLQQAMCQRHWAAMGAVSPGLC